MESVRIKILKHPEGEIELKNLQEKGMIEIETSFITLTPEQEALKKRLESYIGSMTEEEGDRILNEINRSRDEDWAA